ncbi:MAG: [Fe-Fe] hydrogenase large subunit C-terminal domain-containing protein [Candidatus Hydrogenedens sp.]
MITGSYPVKKGDYLGGGQVSSKIKEILSKLAIAPEIIRKIMIAVYESEMNVIIHSYGGEINFTIDDEKIEIVVKDTGPGIPRIDLAVQEGYSTAPDEAREMGFGAGMGLPNIRKNSDYFVIHSEPTGTLLKILIFVKSDKDFSKVDSYVHVTAEKCKKCLQCLSRCPTKAIRLYEKNLYILSHHCINCNECIKICPTKVFDLEDCEKNHEKEKQGILIAPSPWIASILLYYSWDEFEEKFHRKGLEVFPLVLWEEVLQKETQKYIENNEKINFPLILPVCPAVLYWIQTEYPSLIDNIAPYLGPIETAISSFAERRNIFFIPSCPAQISAVNNNKNLDISIQMISPQKSFEMIMDIYKETNKKKQKDKIHNINIDKNSNDGIVTISGIEQVKTFLENIEKKQLPVPIKMVELYACYNGCFGSPYWGEEPTMSKIIFDSFWNEQKHKYENQKIDAIYRVSTINSRKGVRLDEDVRIAIQKLSEIEKINKKLPGYDCGVCGAPACLNFAEDIVIMKKDINNCPYLNRM